MPYHEAFWVVAGTAAPVIALANIVSLTGLLGARERLPGLLPNRQLTQQETDWLDRELPRAGRLLTWANIVGWANGLLQLAILTLALWSLGARTDRASLVIPLIMVDLGLILLLVIGAIIASLRSIQRRIREHWRPLDTPI